MRASLFLFPVVFLLLAACSRQEQAASAPASRPLLSQADPAKKTEPSPQPGEKTDPTRELIKRYAGTYDYDDFLKNEEVKKSLQALLGKDYKRFMENMSGSMLPIDVVSGDLVMYGAGTEAGGEREEAMLVFSHHPLRTHAGIYSGHHVTLYSRQKEYRHLPFPLRIWARPMGELEDLEFPPPQGDSEFRFEQKLVR